MSDPMGGVARHLYFDPSELRTQLGPDADDAR
jgi:hypothetical protein